MSRGGGTWPLWNPDGGHELFYVGPEGMMAVTVDTELTFIYGPPEWLFDTGEYGTQSTMGTVRRIDISPDGKRFLMFKAGTGSTDTDAPPEIILVQNWSDELQRLVP